VVNNCRSVQVKSAQKLFFAYPQGGLQDIVCPKRLDLKRPLSEHHSSGIQGVNKTNCYRTLRALCAVSETLLFNRKKLDINWT